MFAVCVPGLTWKECIAQCPQGVVPACHNAEDTVTISGPQVGPSVRRPSSSPVNRQGTWIVQSDNTELALAIYMFLRRR